MQSKELRITAHLQLHANKRLEKSEIIIQILIK